MIITLRIFFLVVFLSMLSVTSWAGSHVALWSIPREVGGHPWFLATLLDAYWGFLTFYLWQWYKEPSAAARLLWLVAIVLLGNIAMSLYALLVTFRLPKTAPVQDVLLQGAPLSPAIPLGLIVAIATIGAVTAWT